MVASSRCRAGGGRAIVGTCVAVHGGAGPLARARTTPERDRSQREALRESLQAAHVRLARDGAALDAVEAAVRVLEDFELFNAGRGSPLTAAGTVELDAAVMDGRECRAGAVAALQCVRHPIVAARAVLEDGVHVLLAGEGAERFARERGLEPVDPAELVAVALERARQRSDLESSAGTVGAVARDGAGHLAVATSTGGTRGKRSGRIGDSPLIGAGTWADDRTCAVSGTGHGETWIRCSFAHEVDARVRLLGQPLEQACRAALDAAFALGGRGGCIALGRGGDPVLAFTTTGMPRGWIGPDGALRVALYDDEEPG